MLENSTAEVWRWRALWFCALVALTFALSLGASAAARVLREKQANDELDDLARRLAQFRDHYSGWPQVSTPENLLLALRGKVDRNGLPTKSGPWLLHRGAFAFRGADPESVGSAILDPWGRPYQFCYRGAHAERPESIVLFSCGPDGKASSPFDWRAGENGRTAEDADNICRFGSSPQPGH
jgi:hypothetical protein